MDSAKSLMKMITGVDAVTGEEVHRGMEFLGILLAYCLEEKPCSRVIKLRTLVRHPLNHSCKAESSGQVLLHSGATRFSKEAT